MTQWRSGNVIAEKAGHTPFKSTAREMLRGAIAALELADWEVRHKTSHSAVLVDMGSFDQIVLAVDEDGADEDGRETDD
jgi:hypothetical protein